MCARVCAYVRVCVCMCTRARYMYEYACVCWHVRGVHSYARPRGHRGMPAWTFTVFEARVGGRCRGFRAQYPPLIRVWKKQIMFVLFYFEFRGVLRKIRARGLLSPPSPDFKIFRRSPRVPEGALARTWAKILKSGEGGDIVGHEMLHYCFQEGAHTAERPFSWSPGDSNAAKGKGGRHAER